MSNKKLETLVNKLKKDERDERISYSVKLSPKLVKQIKEVCISNNIPQSEFLEEILKSYGFDN